MRDLTDSMCCSCSEFYGNPEHSVMCDPPTNAKLIHTHALHFHRDRTFKNSRAQPLITGILHFKTNADSDL